MRSRHLGWAVVMSAIVALTALGTACHHKKEKVVEVREAPPREIIIEEDRPREVIIEREHHPREVIIEDKHGHPKEVIIEEDKHHKK
jgi:hypothetical protein